MEDRFKFRVWDKWMHVFEERLLLSTDGTLYESEHGDGWVESIDKGRYIIVFCTDLKDKNNNLIFEGDIIKHIHTHNSKHVVIYKDGILGVKTSKHDKNLISPLAYGDPSKNFEIIGNIHENPKLLKVDVDEL